jgi:hypothetical protein
VSRLTTDTPSSPDITDDFLNAHPLEINNTYFGYSHYSGDIDMYQIDLVAGETYSFTGFGATGEFDDGLSLELFGPDQGWIDWGFQFGGFSASGLQFEAPETGSYYLQTSDFSGFPGHYRLGVHEIASADIPDVGDTVAQAAPLLAGERADGEVSNAPDVDVYQFDVQAGLTYTLELQGAELGVGNDWSWQLELLDADGNLIRTVYPWDESYQKALELTPEVDQTLYARVSTNWSSSQTYRLLFDQMGHVSESDLTVISLPDPIIEPLIIDNNTAVTLPHVSGATDVLLMEVVAGELYNLDIFADNTQFLPLPGMDADVVFVATDLSAAEFDIDLLHDFTYMDDGTVTEEPLSLNSLTLDTSDQLGVRQGINDFLPYRNGLILVELNSFSSGYYRVEFDGPGGGDGSSGGGDDGPLDDGQEKGGVENPLQPPLEGNVDVIPDYNTPVTLEPGRGYYAAINHIGDHDEFRLNAEAGEFYVVTTTGVGGNPLLPPGMGTVIYGDYETNRVDYSNYTGSRAVEQYLVSDTEDKELFFYVDAGSRYNPITGFFEPIETTGGYRISALQAQQIETNTDTLGNDIDNATVLDIGQAVIAGLQTQEDKDFFRIQADPGSFVFVTVSSIGDNPLDGFMMTSWLHDPDATGYNSELWIRGRGPGGVGDTSYIVPVLQERELIIEVESNSGGSGDYLFSVVQVFDSVAGDVSTESTLALDTPQVGVLESGQDQDWYKVSWQQGQSYTLQLDGRLVYGSSLDLAIYDQDGNELQRFLYDDVINDGGDLVANFVATYTGDFFVGVADLDIPAVADMDWQSVHRFGGFEFELAVSETDPNEGAQQLSVVSGFAINEGETGTFQLSRSGDLDNLLTITYVLEGVGSNAADSADISGLLPRTGELQMLPGETGASLSVEALVDADTAELSESLQLRITDTQTSDQSVVDILAASAVGTIAGSEHLVSAGANQSVDEGNGGTTPVQFTLTRDGSLEGTLNVDYQILGTGSDPTNGDDFAPGSVFSGQVSFTDGQSQATVAVDVQGDYLLEENETFELQILAASVEDGSAVSIGNPSASVTLVNDDDAPQIQILNAQTTDEGGPGDHRQLVFNLTRSGGTQDRIEVDYRIEGVSATADDIDGALPQSGTLIFESGQTEQQITLGIIGDYTFEDNEQVRVVLEQATSDLGNTVEILNQGTALGTILNDDEQAMVTVEAVGTHVNEGGGRGVSSSGRYWFENHDEPGEMTYVIRREGDVNQALTVDYSLWENGTTPAEHWWLGYERLFRFSRYELEYASQFTVEDTANAFAENPFGDIGSDLQLVTLDHRFEQDEPLLLSQLAGIDPVFGGDLEYTLASFDLSPDPVAFDKVLSGEAVFDLSGALKWKLDQFSLGEYEVDSSLRSQLLLPNYVQAGDELTIMLRDNGIQHHTEGQSLQFGGTGLYFDLDSTGIGLQNLSLDLPLLDPIDLPITPITFDLDDIPILEVNALNGFSRELFEGLDLEFSIPSGDTQSRSFSNHALSEVTNEIRSSLVSLNLNLLEFASELSYQFEPLDWFQEEYELPSFSLFGAEFGAELDFNLLQLLASAGLDLIQAVTLNPTLHTTLTIAGQVFDLDEGTTITLDVPESSFGDLQGSLSYELGMTMDISYRLQPKMSGTIKALGGGLSFSYELPGGEAPEDAEEGDPEDVLSLGGSVGPFIDKTLSVDITEGLEVFSREGIILDDLFDTYIYDFMVPVRQNPELDGAALSGSVTFAPGETEKILRFPVDADRIPEADQTISFHIDNAILADGSSAVILESFADQILRDDDDRVSFSTRFLRWGGGDPHLVSLDGLAYDFHAVGEFVLLESVLGAPISVQIRTEPVPGSDVASLISAIATDMDGHRIVFDAKHASPLTVDGVSLNIPLAPGYQDLGAGRIYFDGNLYTLEYGSGDSLTIDVENGFINYGFLPADDREAGSFHGLLGNFDENLDNEFALADGTQLGAKLSPEQLYGIYADSWRVTELNTLFNYAEGETTDSFTDTSFPARYLDTDALPDEVLAAAENAVDALGILDPTARKNAIYDYLVTGRIDFVEAALEIPITALDDIDIASEENDTLVYLGIVSPTPMLEEGDEGTLDLVYRVYRTGDASGEQTFDVSLSGDLLAEDFITPPPSQITLADGEDTTTITLQLEADTEVDPDRSVTLSISPVVAPEGALITSATATVEVLDDDGVPLPQLTISAPVVEIPEGTGGTTQVQLDLQLDAASDAPVTLMLAIQSPADAAATDAEDFSSQQPLLLELNIPAHADRQSVFIELLADSFLEADEVFDVRVVDIEGAEYDGIPIRIRVLNDDNNAAPQFVDVALPSVQENSSALQIDLLQNATDPEGGPLSVTETLVLDQHNNPVAYSLEDSLLRLDPAQFAEQLAAGEQAQIIITTTVSDADGASLPRQFTLVVEGVNGPFTFYEDQDEDGYGDSAAPISAYEIQPGWTVFGNDWDDSDNSIYPGAEEVNDGKDNDQDGEVDEEEGSAEPNVIEGGTNSDYLVGTDDDDRLLSGGGGFDFFTGGGGNDVFVFSALGGDGREMGTIIDYTPGEDQIELPHQDISFAFAVGTDLHIYLDGGDYDTLIVSGVSSLEVIDFV